MAFSAHIINHGQFLSVPHSDNEHNLKLLSLAGRLPRTHRMAYCNGCLWTIQWPTRIGNPSIEEIASQHMISAHFTALFQGDAIAPDFLKADGGTLLADFEARKRMVVRK